MEEDSNLHGSDLRSSNAFDVFQADTSFYEEFDPSVDQTLGKFKSIHINYDPFLRRRIQLSPTKSEFKKTVELLLCVHGWKNSDKAEPMTLIILGVNLPLHSRISRLHSAKISLAFGEYDKTDPACTLKACPAVVAYSSSGPQEHWNKPPADPEGNPRYSKRPRADDIKTATRNAMKETGTFYTRQHFHEMSTLPLRNEKTGKIHGVEWYFEQNGLQEYGVEPTFHVAALIKRSHDQEQKPIPFKAEFGIQLKAEFAHDVELDVPRVFRTRNDPIYFNPLQKPLHGVTDLGESFFGTIQTNNLGAFAERTKLNGLLNSAGSISDLELQDAQQIIGDWYPVTGLESNFEESHPNVHGDQSGVQNLNPYLPDVDPYLSTDIVAHRLAKERRDLPDDLRHLTGDMLQAVSQLQDLKVKVPAMFKAEVTMSELQEIFRSVTETEDMVSDLRHLLPRISRLANLVIKTILDESTNTKEDISKRSSVETPVLELTTILESMSSIWDVCFFPNLDGFCSLVHGSIESVLTVTGSSQDAFASSAATYVEWRWGQQWVRILDWLLHFVVTSHAPYHAIGHRLDIREDQNSAAVCIELHGELLTEYDGPLSQSNVAIRVRRMQCTEEHYRTLVSDVGSILAWIVATFKDTQEGLAFTRAKIENASPTQTTFWNKRGCVGFQVLHEEVPEMSLGGRQGMCWHQLFTGLNVVVDFPIPTRPEGMHGLELPLSVMTSFSGANCPVSYKDGYFLKGWRNALFPITTDSGPTLLKTHTALQWHLFESQETRLYIAEAAKAKPDLVPIKTTLSPKKFCTNVEQAKRHFLGLYEEANIRIGTNASRDDEIAPICNNTNRIRRSRSSILEWNRSMNLSLGGSFLGLSLGISTGFRIREREERRLFMKQKHIDGQILEETFSRSTILYDVKTKTAWMLPQICVIMRLVQVLWSSEHYGRTVIDYPTFNDMTRSGLRSAYDAFVEQQQLSRSQQDELKKIFFRFAKALHRLEDNEDLRPPGRHNRSRLAGVDFATLASLDNLYTVFTRDIRLNSSGNWPQMLNSNWKNTPNSPYRVVTLFCSRLDSQPIFPSSLFCDTWLPPLFEQDYLITTISCLQELAKIHGRDPVMLSRDHVWVRGEKGPYDACNGRVCNRLQRIVSKGEQPDRRMSAILENASFLATIIFGDRFDVKSQQQCRLKSP